MLKKLLPIIFLLLLCIRPALAYDVVVVKGGLSGPYEEVQRSFVREFNRLVPTLGFKSIEGHRFIEFVINDNHPENKLAAQILNSKPDLIVALGNRSLLAVRDISTVPILYMLVTGAEKIIDRRSNITGFNLTVSPGVQFAETAKRLPKVKRVGILFDPRYSGALLEEAYMEVAGFEFVTRSADSPKDVPRLLESLKGQVDLVWMIPDRTVTNPQTIPSYMQFSFINNVPLLTFSEIYIKPGSTIAVTFDLGETGVIAARRAARILAGEPFGDLPLVSPPPHKTIINNTVAKKLNLAIVGAE